MFTGIVEDIGTVAAVTRRAKESAITIRVNKIDPRGLVLGESIAVSGVCLTVTSLEGDTFTVDASRETLSRTSLGKLRVGSAVNLELSLKAGGRMGGHIVSGHVDGVGKVKSKRKRGSSVELRFTATAHVLKYIVEKGSVAVDGVSLTVNSVSSGEFGVNIIPYTLAETTFGSLRRGSPVNIECDIIGKYVEKFMTAKRDDYTVY